jgi:hypothetical protein
MPGNLKIRAFAMLQSGAESRVARRTRGESSAWRFTRKGEGELTRIKIQEPPLKEYFLQNARQKVSRAGSK